MGVPRRTLPPFPVIASSGSGPTVAPMPVLHLKIKEEATDEPETIAEKASRGDGVRRLLRILTLVAVGGGLYFGWPHLRAIVARFKETKALGADANAPAAGPTPSDTLNKLAHAPAAAINKAQDALAARRASGQTRVDAAAAGDDIPDRPKSAPAAISTPAKPAPPPVKAPATMAPVAPGLAASVAVEAAPDASPAFRTFVANAKVSGVFQGAPARAMINGKLTRVGETADLSLGAIFHAVDPDRRQLIFKDRSGATVSRKY